MGAHNQEMFLALFSYRISPKYGRFKHAFWYQISTDFLKFGAVISGSMLEGRVSQSFQFLKKNMESES